MELKHIMGTENLPSGTLALGKEGILSAISSFEDAKKLDIQNEKLPPPVSDEPSNPTSTASSLERSPSQSPKSIPIKMDTDENVMDVDIDELVIKEKEEKSVPHLCACFGK